MIYDRNVKVLTDFELAMHNANSMVLKTIEFKRNPLDYSGYIKPNKQIKEQFQFERLKMSYLKGSLSLADYMYAVAAHLPVIEYIHEWLLNDEEEEDLNIAVNNLSVENQIFSVDLTQQEREREIH